MTVLAWQKSTFSGGPNGGCLHLAAAPDGTVRLRESDEPGIVLTAGRPQLGALLDHLRPPRPRRSPVSDIPDGLDWIVATPDGAPPATGSWIEVAVGAGELIHIRETSDPETVVTTTRVKWEAFTKGVMAGEFDHFVEGVA
jgi:hypothetical protein